MTTKRYEMLKTVRGVRTGEFKPTLFKQGEVYEIDDSLAEQLGHLEAVEETKKAVTNTETKAPVAPHGGQAGIDPHTMRIEELVSLARDTYGLNVDSKMSREAILSLLDKKKTPAEKRETKVVTPAETKSGEDDGEDKPSASTKKATAKKGKK